MALTVVACSQHRDITTLEEVTEGSLQLALVAHDGPDEYRLEAAFTIEGPERLHLDSKDAPASADSLSEELMPGSYQVTIDKGFRVLKLVNGALRPVRAQLTSPAQQAVSIASADTSQLNYRFAVGDEAVDSGAGQLNIGFSVEAARVNAHRLRVSDDGIALMTTPSRARLTDSVMVVDTLGLDAPWTAHSDQPWLHVTRHGLSGDPLVLTADPAGLQSDSIHYATVSLTSSDLSVGGADRVRVGLWVGASTLQPKDIVNVPAPNVAADPIRPYVYVSAGSAISVYNIYTAELVEQIETGFGAVGSLAVSTDGSELFASVAGAILPFALDSHEFGVPWSGQSGELVYARCQDEGLLISGSGRVARVATGELLAGQFYGGGNIAASKDGSMFCALDSGYSPYSFACYEFDCRTDTEPRFAQAISGGGWDVPGVGSNGRDIALNADATRIYVASGAPYSFTIFDRQLSVLGSLPGAAYPNNVEVADDGRVFAAAQTYYEAVDAWVYDPDGTLRESFDVSPGYATNSLSGQLRVSGDGVRMVVATEDQLLQFITTR